jgi:DNA-binding NarL/FixJ family response regulator
MGIRVAIFDSNRNTRNNIILLLNADPTFKVVGNFSEIRNCIQNVLNARPDVVLMDIEMPDMDGIAAIKLLTQEFPHVQILIQTVSENDEQIIESICAGASGYLLKSQLSFSLINAIKDLKNGGSPMSPTINRRVLNLLQQGCQSKKQSTNENYNLTAREKEVLAAIVSGLSYKMIGHELGIRYETVRSHMKNIYEKLQVASLTEVVAKAIKQNLV